MRCCRASFFPEHRRGSQWSKSCVACVSNATTSEQGWGELTHIATGTVIKTSGARDIRGEARRKRKVRYLIQGGVVLHLPHQFPPHGYGQCYRAGSTRRRGRILEGRDGFECLTLFPSCRRCVLSARACSWPYCRDAFTISGFVATPSEEFG
jgi:hypothetical protein